MGRKINRTDAVSIGRIRVTPPEIRAFHAFGGVFCLTLKLQRDNCHHTVENPEKVPILMLSSRGLWR